MWVKFICKEPRLVGARHFSAGDFIEFHDGLANRLIRHKLAEKIVQPPVLTPGAPETATLKPELENPEAKRDASAQPKGPKARWA